MEETAELKAFTDVAQRLRSATDLVEAALRIARHACADLDVAAYRQRLADMGEEARRRVDPADGPREIVAKINQYLFVEFGLRGNEEDYFDPKNSFINEVLDRKIGIPITLSVIYMSVAEAIPLPLEGVGFPGHFLIRYAGEGDELLIDPFHQGVILSVPDCQDLLDHVYEGAVEFRPEFLHPAGRRQILQRMLNNLKGIYLRREDYPNALAIVDRLLCLEPNAPDELRDRGILHYRLRSFGKALTDLERYLRLAPNAQDREAVQHNIRLLRHLVAGLN